MRLNNKLIPVLFAMVICPMFLAGCDETLTPEQETVVSYISGTSGKVARISFSTFELADSTTVAEELDRRKALFSTKVKVESGYKSEKHRQSAAQAEAILAGIETLRQDLSSSLDDVLYRTWKFSCKGKFEDGGEFECRDMYINITRDGVACNLKNDGRYHNGMGRFIPGYSELLEKNRITEDE